MQRSIGRSQFLKQKLELGCNLFEAIDQCAGRRRRVAVSVWGRKRVTPTSSTCPRASVLVGL